MCEYFLCGEIIRARREALGMSQEELAEGICDPVMISRIECGHVAPKRKIFAALMQKVGMTGCGYDTRLPGRSPEAWKIATEITRLLNQSKAKEVELFIEQLEEMLDMPSKYELQFLLHVKAVTQGNLNKISWEERKNAQAEALYLTMPHIPITKLKKWHFSEGEMACVLSLAHAEDRLGNREAFIELLSAIKQKYEASFMNLRHCVNHYEAICRNLGDILGNAGRYEEGIQIEYDGIEWEMRAGVGAILGPMTFDCGWNIDQLLKRGTLIEEDALKYLSISYYLVTLYGNESDTTVVKKYIYDNYHRVL